MNFLSKKIGILTLITVISISMATASSHAKSNLKSSSGHTVGSMDKKFFHTKKPKSKHSVTVSDWPSDWKWERDINPDKPLFNQLDENTNGAISKREFRAAVMNDREDEVFSALDKNKDKTINRSELAKFSKN